MPDTTKSSLDRVIDHRLDAALQKGGPKTKGNGQLSRVNKAATRINTRTLAAVRDHLLNEVGVLHNVIALAKGEPIPGVPNPEPKQIIDANYQLLKRIMPELKAVEITGQDGGPIEVQEKVNRIIELVGEVTATVTDNKPLDLGEDGSALDAANKGVTDVKPE